MRNRFAQTLYDLAKANPKLAVIVADISPAGGMDQLRNDFPDRFINTGVAEQVMIGMAAGMALKGYRMFCYTIATFALYRCFEFVRDDLAYQNLPVTVVGIGGGVTYSTLGSTHHAMEDVAIASSVPNLRVICPGDPYETAEATKWCANQNQGGPIYMRLGKAGEPSYSIDEPWVYGRPRTLQQAENSDLCIMAYGPTGLDLAFQVSAGINKTHGDYQPAIVSVHSLDSNGWDNIDVALRLFKRVCVIEEAVDTLGSAVRAYANQHRLGPHIYTFALEPTFIQAYGSHRDLLQAHGLTAPHILKRMGYDQP